MARYIGAYLIDPDQGVCPEGHPCYIVTTPRGTVERSCATPHGDGGEWYYSDPLIAEHVTSIDVDAAENNGADSHLIEWARETLAERGV